MNKGLRGHTGWSEFRNYDVSVDCIILANIADPDELPYDMTFHLGLTVCHGTPFIGLQYSKTCVKRAYSHSQIDKTKILMTNGSLMKVKSIAKCSLWSILQYF